MTVFREPPSDLTILGPFEVASAAQISEGKGTCAEKTQPPEWDGWRGVWCAFLATCCGQCGIGQQKSDAARFSKKVRGSVIQCPSFVSFVVVPKRAETKGGLASGYHRLGGLRTTPSTDDRFLEAFRLAASIQKYHDHCRILQYIFDIL